VSIESVVARIAELQSAFAPPTPAPSNPTQTTATAAGTSSFAGMLTSAMGPGALGTASPIAPVAGASGTGSAIVAAAAAEVGQAEQPPGSNDSPRIAQYRAATAGAPGPGPWCAYFTSWACRQAGVPVGDDGEGFGSVDALYAWAQRTGRAAPAGSGYVPRPGDLIVFNQHIGVVENVLPGGQIQTIEGNSSDQVSRRTHSPGDAIGFVRTG
jgi:CHAP domain-containing protein